MFFKKLLKQMIKNDKEVMLLQEKIRRLEQALTEMKQQEPPPPPAPTTIIESVNVENLYVDRVEHNNTFGALGIKSLEGRLNIGANYGLDAIPEAQKQKNADKQKQAAAKMKKPSAAKQQEGPVYHIR